MSFTKLKDIKSHEIFPGFHGTFIHAETMTIAHWKIKAGAEVPRHNHVHEQVVNVITGKLELTIGSETRVMDEGAAAVIPSQVYHSAKGVTDCYVIDVFHPVREDYMK